MTTANVWREDEKSRLVALHGSMSLRQISDNLGRSLPSIRAQITRMGLAKKSNWSAEEEASLRALYESAGPLGVLRLGDFAAAMGRDAGNVSRKARQMGLCTNANRRVVEIRKDRRKFATEAELSAAKSMWMKSWIAEKGHPRGMAGKKHSPEALAKISAASKASQLFLSEEEKAARATKTMKTKLERYGAVGVARARGTWKAGWREIGGKRNFYRSRWEANYARYLQWLKEIGQISEWQHEPETFWFEQIKRGTRSYLPDFRVWENDGSTALHEVKGWMDQRSRTTLSRMKKYHPDQKIVLIDGAQYRSIRRKVMGLIPGWEDSPRDSHA